MRGICSKHFTCAIYTPRTQPRLTISHENGLIVDSFSSSHEQYHLCDSSAVMVCHVQFPQHSPIVGIVSHWSGGSQVWGCYPCSLPVPASRPVNRGCAAKSCVVCGLNLSTSEAAISTGYDGEGKKRQSLLAYAGPSC